MDGIGCCAFLCQPALLFNLLPYLLDGHFIPSVTIMFLTLQVDSDLDNVEWDSDSDI
jgi:hypothetical protein